MYTNSNTILPKQLNSQFKFTWLLSWWLLTILTSTFAYGENSLQDISFTALPGNKVNLSITLAETATAPNVFTVDSPPRLVLDFPNTKLNLPNRNLMIGIGAVRNVKTVEADGRTRVVFYFDHKVTYDLKLQANTVLLRLDNGLNVATQNTSSKITMAQAQIAKPAPPNEQPNVGIETSSASNQIPPDTQANAIQPSPDDSIQPELPKEQPTNSSPELPAEPSANTVPPDNSNPPELKIAGAESAINNQPPIEQPMQPIHSRPIHRQRRSILDETVTANSQTHSSLQSVDFHRGLNGEGQVVITLNNPNTVINLTEEGRSVIVEILNAKLPKALHQKLDVIDFGTPVQKILTEPKGNGVRISVNATGEYEYVAYQVDKVYTLEFYQLTPEKQEKQQKEKELQQKQEERRKKQERKPYTGERLTLNFQDIPVRSLLQLLGEFADHNIVISDEVKGNVTLRLKNVPWDQAVDIILKTKFLGKRENDNVIYIAPNADLISQEQAELEANQKILEADQKALEVAQKIDELAPLKLELIQLNYAKGKDIQDTLSGQKETKSNIAKTSTANSDNAVKSVTTSSPWDHDPGSSLLSERGSVNFYEATNTLLIKDTAENIEKIRALIAALDVPAQQILIESRIVIADNNFSKELGVRFGWSGARELGGGHAVNIGGGQNGHIENSGTVNHGTWLSNIAGNPFGAGFQNDGSTENLMVNLPASSSAGSVDFLIGKIGSYLLQLELTAMQDEGRGEVISSPRVVASNHTKAAITQGVEIPYTTATSSDSNNSIATTEFKKIQLNLIVTPHITLDNRINLELDVIKETPVYFGTSIGADTRSVVTTVLVDDGETVSLGGVYEQSRGNSKTSVPVFGDIPVFGNLFKRTKKNDTQKELLIFVTPKILRPEAIKIAK